MAHYTHETCQARIIQPTLTSPTLTSLYGSICTASHTMIVTKLQMIGKDLCVEYIKLFNPHPIEALFGGEDYILMLRAELAWEDLGGRYQYSFKKPNPNLKNLTETNSDPASSGSTA